MKLRASFFNGTVFKKNLTRFAPAWVLCTLYVLIYGFLSSFVEAERFIVSYAEGGIQLLAPINFFYAFLVAQLLFGDLYQSRLCSGIHAMPIRRECWFFTNIISGLFFMLVPVGVLNILTAIASAGSVITGSEMIVPRVFLGQFLSYVCFLGIAVFSTLCVGKRFAAALVYGLLNYGAYLAYGLAEVFYTRDYYGVSTPIEPFTRFSPMVQLDSFEYLKTEVVSGKNYYDILRGHVTLGEGWSYLWICGAVGVAALVLALLVYRKRHLERAGDFITVKILEPVFLLVYTLAFGLLFSLFWVISGTKFFLYLGIAVGWFTCLMFLKRTTRVFKWKNILGCVLLMIALGVSFFINNMDPFGIESRIPEKDDVKAVYISTGSEYKITNYSKDNSEVIKLENSGDIETALRLHTLALEEKAGDSNGDFQDYYSSPEYVRYYIRYELKDGTTLTRQYYSASDSEAGDILRGFFSRISCVLGLTEKHIANGTKVFSNSFQVENNKLELSNDQLQSLVEAIAADCADGNIAQIYSLHKDDAQLGWILLQPRYLSSGSVRIFVYESCTHTIQWLVENDMLQYFDLENKDDYEFYYG